MIVVIRTLESVGIVSMSDAVFSWYIRLQLMINKDNDFNERIYKQAIDNCIR